MNDIDTWKSKFGHLKSIARENGVPLEIITEGEIPQLFKDYFDAKGILFKENYF